MTGGPYILISTFYIQLSQAKGLHHRAAGSLSATGGPQGGIALCPIQADKTSPQAGLSAVASCEGGIT